MFFIVLLIMALFLLVSWIIVTSSRFSFRQCDMPLLSLLVAGGFFYGIPIFLGFCTGVIAWWTILLSLLLLISLTMWMKLKNRRSRLPWHLLFKICREMPIFEKVGWVLVSGTLLFLLFVGSQLSFSVWDGLGYHAHNPMRWAIDNEFKLDSFGDSRLDMYDGVAETYPNIKAVVPFLVMDLTGGTKGTAIVQWPFLLFLLSSLHVIIRRNGLPRWGTLVSFVFCLCAPEVLIQSVSTYADLGFFSVMFCLIATCLIFWQEGPCWNTILFCAISFGFVVGMKPTGISLCAPFGLVFLVFVYLRSNKGSVFLRLREVLAGFLTVVFISVCMAGPWFIHALEKYKNPIYPIGLNIGERVILSGPGDMDTVQKHIKNYTGKEGVDAWWHVMKDTQRAPCLGGWHSGVGAPAFTMGIVSMVVFFLFGQLGPDWKRYLPISILFFTAWLGMPTVNVARFAFIFLGIMSFCFVWFLAYSSRWPRWAAFILFLMIIFYDISRSFPALLFRPRPAEMFVYALVSGNSSWVNSQGFPEDYGPINFWCDTAEDGEKIGVVQGKAPTYFLPRDWDARMTIIPPSSEFESVGEWFEELKNLEVTHLYISWDKPEFELAEENVSFFKKYFSYTYSPATHGWSFSRPERSAIYRLINDGGICDE